MNDKGLPRDPENADFVKWFSPDEKEDYKKFFDEYGFVAVKVLTPEECKESIEDIWNFVEATNTPNKPQIVRNDWSTCTNDVWPGMKAEGILGPQLAFSRVALERRQNPVLHEVFSEILGTTELMCNHDKYGLFRPTKDVDVNGETRNFPERKTMENLHLDGNPWSYEKHPSSESASDSLRYLCTADFIQENNNLGPYNEGNLYVQGLLNFMDNRPEDGGFQLVPGFYKNMKEWVQDTQDSLGKRFEHRSFIMLPNDLPELRSAERISVPAGCVVIWNQYTAHGSKPNQSSRPR